MTTKSDTIRFMDQPFLKPQEYEQMLSDEEQELRRLEREQKRKNLDKIIEEITNSNPGWY